MNTPVVTVESLPVGPASAAVALHPAPEAGVTLAVRSVRTGHVAFFTSARDATDRPERVLDAALSYGESMGFLFDDDEVGSGAGGAEAAARRWRVWLGEGDLDPDPAEHPVAPTPSLRVVPEALADVPPPALLLSKFRRVPPETIAPAGPAAGSDLRVRLTSRF
jgi:hypothetical protein